jgi:hypothetical protein
MQKTISSKLSSRCQIRNRARLYPNSSIDSRSIIPNLGTRDDVWIWRLSSINEAVPDVARERSSRTCCEERLAGGVDDRHGPRNIRSMSEPLLSLSSGRCFRGSFWFRLIRASAGIDGTIGQRRISGEVLYRATDSLRDSAKVGRRDLNGRP